MYIGAHVPVTGGLCNAPANGAAVGAEAIQIFTRNQMQWRCRPLADDECGAFREQLTRSGVKVALAHGSYLVNLASPVDDLLTRSRECFRAVEQSLLPVADEGGVDLVLRGQFVGRAVALQRRQGDPGLERRRIGLPLTRHLLPLF